MTDPMTDEELAVARGFVDGNLPTGLDGRAVVDLVRRLLDEVQRLRAESIELRRNAAFAAAVISGDAAEMLTESLAKARSECAALTAKAEAAAAVGERVEGALAHIRECLHIGLQDAKLYDEAGTKRIGEWADFIDKQIRAALAGSGMPHTPAQEAAPWIPSFNGDECPHRPEWSCPDHGECRACECDCNTYNADLEEPDLTLIPADLIVSDPEVCSGRPTMRGTRILASMIAGHLAAGTTWEELAEWYPQMPIPPAETAADGLPDAERGTGVREPHTRPQGDGGSDA